MSETNNEATHSTPVREWWSWKRDWIKTIEYEPGEHWPDSMSFLINGEKYLLYVMFTPITDQFGDQHSMCLFFDPTRGINDRLLFKTPALSSKHLTKVIDFYKAFGVPTDDDWCRTYPPGISDPKLIIQRMSEDYALDGPEWNEAVKEMV